MRIRSLKPEFWRDEESTGIWPVDEKLVYAGLWSVADDEGRLEWSARKLQVELFPYAPDGMQITRGGPPIDLVAVLTRLVESGRVVPYEADGRQFAWLPKFKAHQKPNRPTPSKFPPPTKGLRTSPVGLRESSRATPGALSEDSSPERRGGEMERERSSLLARAPARARTRVASTVPEVDPVDQDSLPDFVDPPDPPVELGPKSTELRARLERTWDHGLVIASEGRERATADELEQLLDSRSLDDVERFLVRTAERRREPPGSLAWCLPILRAMPAPEPASPAAEGPDEWQRIREVLRERLRRDQYEQLFAQLPGRMVDGVLVLTAADPYAATFLRDEYFVPLSMLAHEVLGGAIQLRIEPDAPAEGAPT